DKLQFHHIFPKALLRRKGRAAREADDIANLAFISGKTNRQIGDREPTDYLSEFLEQGSVKAFQAQCIPCDRALLVSDAYESFLRERRRLVSERLNSFLGI